MRNTISAVRRGGNPYSPLPTFSYERYDNMSSLDSTQLHALVHYDPDTGLFTWRVNRQNVRAGDIAGTITDRGYCRITVSGRAYAAHRLAWLYVYGAWPTEQIDHINGIRNDNRIENLRDVSAAANSQNQRQPQGGNPFIGVSWVRKSNRWMVRIRIDGRQRYLGCFATSEEAQDAYIKAKRAHHTGCTV